MMYTEIQACITVGLFKTKTLWLVLITTRSIKQIPVLDQTFY